MKLTLLRHGETEGSQKNLYYGAADIPALPKSLEALQQKALTGVYPTAEHYYVSGMTRTIQTLRAIYGDVAYTGGRGVRDPRRGDVGTDDALVRRNAVRLSAGTRRGISG